MILGIIIISIIGTILHFTYDWSNHNKIVGIFSAVNESTWEHIKMALSATLLYSIFDGYFLGMNPNYFVAKAVSLLIIIFLIPIIFYSYSFFTKKNILIIDILSFFLSIILSNIIFYKILDMNALSYSIRYFGTIGFFVLFGFYMILTLMPIKSFLFKDPITKKYGIKAHLN